MLIITMKINTAIIAILLLTFCSFSLSMRVSRRNKRGRKKVKIIIGDYIKKRNGYLWRGKFFRGRFKVRRHYGRNYRKVRGGYILNGKRFKGNYRHSRHFKGHYKNGNWMNWKYGSKKGENMKNEMMENGGEDEVSESAMNS